MREVGLKVCGSGSTRGAAEDLLKGIGLLRAFWGLRFLGVEGLRFRIVSEIMGFFPAINMPAGAKEEWHDVHACMWYFALAHVIALCILIRNSAMLQDMCGFLKTTLAKFLEGALPMISLLISGAPEGQLFRENPM